MNVRHTMVLAGVHHERLQDHLFPGDGSEAAAILLCTRVHVDGIKLLVKDLIMVPQNACKRFPHSLEWPGEFVEMALEHAEQDDLTLVLMHSHPGGFFQFSEADDDSDKAVMPSLFMARNFDWNDVTVHGSAIMIPGGGIRARMYDDAYSSTPVDVVAVYGDEIKFYWNEDNLPTARPLAFSDAMRDELAKLRFVIVGSSGTGSIVVQQLARMGAGDLTLIDYDVMENKNLNRILGSTTADAEANEFKVTVLMREIASFAPTTCVHAVPASISTREAVIKAGRADIIFCCVDSEEGRSLCDRMASAFLQPVLDVGVVIPVRTSTAGNKAIIDIHGRIDYIQPGGSTLEDRGVYCPASLAAEYLRRTDPDAFSQRVNEGYMPGSMEQAPSVITVNMRAASTCVQELIARAFPYRLDSNRRYARTTISLAACEEEFFDEDAFMPTPSSLFGQGFKEPLLGVPSLGEST